MLIGTKWVCIKDQKKIGCKRRRLNSKQLKIHLFHVKNESILIQTPEGKNILYDCGSSTAGDDVHRRLSDLGIKKIHVMIASHPHEDHAAGFVTLSKIIDSEIKLGRLYDNGESGIDGKWFKKYERFRSNLKKYSSLKKSKERKLRIRDPDVKISLFVSHRWKPRPSSTPSTIANYKKYRSVWMTIKYKNSTILFEGDSRKKYEEIMLEDFSQICEAHVLKLSEHGSPDSTQRILIQRVNPIISVACNKHHKGLPHIDVKDRLKENGAKRVIHSTNENDNDIIISMDGIKRKKRVRYRMQFKQFEDEH